MGVGMNIIDALVNEYGLEIGMAPKNILANRLQGVLDGGAALSMSTILAPLNYAAPGHSITSTIINELKDEHPEWFQEGGNGSDTISLDVGNVGMDGNPREEVTIEIGELESVVLADDADQHTHVLVYDFSDDDVIQVSNANEGDYFFTNDAENIYISYNNTDAGVFNMITLVGVLTSDVIIDGTEASFEEVMGPGTFQLV